jgi:hypothetical protein
MEESLSSSSWRLSACVINNIIINFNCSIDKVMVYEKSDGTTGQAPARLAQKKILLDR